MPKLSRRAVIVTIVAIFVALVYLQLRAEKRTSDRRIGFLFDDTSSRIVVTTVTPDSPAAQAGLRTGDVVLSLNGRAIAGRAQFSDTAESFVRGQPVTYRIQRGSETFDLVATPGMAIPWRPLLLNNLAAFCHLLLGLLAFSQRRDDLRARLLTIFAFAVAFELAMPQNTLASLGVGIGSNVFFYALTGLQFATEVHLASTIPEPRPFLRERPWLVRLFYLVGLGCAAAAIVTYLANLRGWQPFPWTITDVEWAQANLFLPFWALLVTAFLGHAALTWREPVGRQQSLLILLGVLPWATIQFLDLVGTFFRWEVHARIAELQPLALLCYPIAVFAAIFRSHLFDLELVVRRSLLYTTVTSALILVFYGAVGMGGALLSQLVGNSGSAWMVGAATLVMGLLFGPLRTTLQTGIDRRFFPERNALRRRLVELAIGLPAHARLPLMGRHLTVTLCEMLHIRSATLMLGNYTSGPLVTVASSLERSENEGAFLLPRNDPFLLHLLDSRRPLSIELARRRLHRTELLPQLDSLDLAVPLLHQEHLVGVLLLGHKLDSRSFSADEIELIDLFSHHLATVFENARLFEAATDDALTRLSRREVILERLTAELQRAIRYDRPLSIAMADIDHFKMVNDSHGHLMGDLLLALVARALNTGLRTSDAIGRYGGEEFLILLPETDLRGACEVAEKLRRQVEQVSATTEESHPVRVTISLGVASLWETLGSADPGVTTLLTAADRALYWAKHRGRNRIEAVPLGTPAFVPLRAVPNEPPVERPASYALAEVSEKTSPRTG